MRSYGPDSGEILRRLASKPKRMVELDEALWAVRSHRDRRPPSVCAAIASKRAVQDAEDLRRFIEATAHLPDAAFGHLIPPDEWPPEFSGLLLGLGARRQLVMARLCFDEPDRRAARTAHQVIAERRLATEN